MKIQKLIFIYFLFLVQLAVAQDVAHLNDCQKLAREQHPLIKQKELYQQVSELKLANNETNFLPQMVLKSQATYQSDVTQLGISLPNVNIPSIAKDQYKAYIDVKQNIWDGGLIKANAEIVERQGEMNKQGVEVELYKLREQINNLFFTSFLLQENLNILTKKQETLESQKTMMESGVNNGMILQSELDLVLAELIKVKQVEIELQSGKETALSALSILTGAKMETLQNLRIDEVVIDVDQQMNRPELSLFENQIDLLKATSVLIQKKRNPKLFGFGQAGYGRPGLNMLSNQFDTFYLVGMGVNWTVLDWKNSRRDKAVIQLQQQMVQSYQKQFEQNIKIALDREYRKIIQLKEIQKSDRELIELQKRITKSSASKLENGAITTSDYIKDLNAEMAANITFETHKVQLELAKISYQNIQGK